MRRFFFLLFMEDFNLDLRLRIICLHSLVLAFELPYLTPHQQELLFETENFNPHLFGIHAAAACSDLLAVNLYYSRSHSRNCGIFGDIFQEEQYEKFWHNHQKLGYQQSR